MFEQISKRRARLIKTLMESKKQRSRYGGFVVEGLKGVAEAVKAGFTVEFAVVSEEFIQRYTVSILSELFNAGVLVFQASDKDFAELSDTVTPQGILALAKVSEYDLTDLLKGNPLIVALDRVSDPGNLGTIIRTSDAASAACVIVGKGCADAYNPKTVRATMGSIFHIPIIYVEDLTKVLYQLKSQGLKVIVSHLEGKVSHRDVDYSGPTVLVFGNEDDGVSEGIAEICDIKTVIEMPGASESLNVAVAHGIMIFEAVKQRCMHPFSL